MKSTVMISHYPCELYNDTLKTWRRLDYSTMTRAGVRVESLYMNYPIPLLLQCPGVAGKDYIDRQRIKRKVARLVGKLSQLEAHERAVVLSSIIDHFDYLISPNN